MTDTADSQPPPLPELLAAYTMGDDSAQRALLENVESILQRMVRGEMGRALRTVEESMDLTQSVMLGFHIRAAAGKVSLTDRRALEHYLRAMVKNKMANRGARLKTLKRGGGLAPEPLSGSALEIPSADLSASTVLRVKEIKRRLQNALSAEEMVILEGRLTGRTNEEIGQDLGGKSAASVRMAWTRARERLVRIGLVEGG